MIKNLKDLKKEYQDLTSITNFNDLQDLAINFVRCCTWKKEREHEIIKRLYYNVFPKVIIDIKTNGWDLALKTLKNGDLHKAINIKKVFAYYGLNYEDYKQQIITNKKKILMEE